MIQNRPHNTPAATRRQLQIEECLLQNMLQIPYEQITVADICRQLEISRRAYYTYFQNKDACLNAMIDRMIKVSMLDIPHTYTKNIDILQITIAYLNYWKDHRSFLDGIVKQDMVPLFRERSFQFFRKERKWSMDLLNTPAVKADDDILRLYIGLRVGVLLQWHSRNFDTPVEEMATKYIRIFQDPILQW